MYRRSTVTMASLVVAVGACTQLLGDDFGIITAVDTTVTAASGGGATTSGSGGAGASGGSGGAGPTVGVGGTGGSALSYQCSWSPNSTREVASLDGAAVPTWEEKMLSVESGSSIRLFLQRNSPTGQNIELHTIDDTDYHMELFPGNSLLDVKRADADRVAALYMYNIPSTSNEQMRLLVLDDNDSRGDDAAVHELNGGYSGFSDWSGSFATVGNGNATFIGHVVVAFSFQGQSTRNVVVNYWQGAHDFGEEIFSHSTLGEKDFRVASLTHVPGATVLHLGDRFDGALMTRVFEVPDDTQLSAQLAPVHTIPADPSDPSQSADAFVAVSPRSGGDFLVSYAKLDANLTLLMGTSSASSLKNHSIGDATGIADVGTLATVPQNGNFAYSDDGLVITGMSNDKPDEIKFLVANRTDGVRFYDSLPFPDEAIFPGNRTLVGVQAVHLSSTVFDMIGGSLAVAWIMKIDNAHHRLYYGEVDCSWVQ